MNGCLHSVQGLVSCSHQLSQQVDPVAMRRRKKKMGDRSEAISLTRGLLTVASYYSHEGFLDPEIE
jgi:hypothetical protein